MMLQSVLMIGVLRAILSVIMSESITQSDAIAFKKNTLNNQNTSTLHESKNGFRNIVPSDNLGMVSGG